MSPDSRSRALRMRFREALALPASACRDVQYSTHETLDTVLCKTLLDDRRGRVHQASKRFRNLLERLGIDTETPLVEQQGKLNETTASLLIFELLFLFEEDIDLRHEQSWLYVESITLFDPDDVICHGAIYNMLLVFFLRSGDLTTAHKLADMALNSYRRCGRARSALRPAAHLFGKRR